MKRFVPIITRLPGSDQPVAHEVLIRWLIRLYPLPDCGTVASRQGVKVS